METNKTSVKIKLVTEIKDKGNNEQTVVEELGSFYHKGQTSVLTFTERKNEEDEVNSLITIQQDKVSVKRTGAVEMHQVFKKKQRTENVYRHAYGTMHMETHTDQITYERSTNGKKGKLFISYTTSLNGEIDRRHRLTLSFKEEA